MIAISMTDMSRQSEENRDSIRAIRGTGTNILQELEAAYAGKYNQFVGYASYFVKKEFVEEVVQDTFMNIITRSKNPPPLQVDNMDAYIKAAIVNRSKMFHRRNNLKAVKEEKYKTYQVESQNELNEREETIFEAIKSLTDIQKQCIILRFWEDKTSQQISKELGISLSTVKTHIRRACGSIESKVQEVQGV